MRDLLISLNMDVAQVELVTAHYHRCLWDLLGTIQGIGRSSFLFVDVEEAI
jgi:hypothetical protein